MNQTRALLFFRGTLLFLFLQALVPLGARGQEGDTPLIPVGKSDIQNFNLGPNCGIYCAMGALSALGIHAPYPEMASPKYVGSLQGSSMGELVQALENHGAFTLSLKGLTPSGLIALETPCILHVRRDGTTDTHAHWVLFLGIEMGKAKLFNPPNGVELISLEELLYLWDGQGIAVFPQKLSPTTTFKVKSLQLLDSLQILALGFLGLGLGFLPFPGSLPRNTFWGFGARLGLATLFCLVLPLTFTPASVTDRWELYATIARAREKPSFQSISAEELQKRMKDPNLALVDARLASDFQHGHLPGAQSLPIDCGPGMVRSIAKDLGARELVVYCQSDGCSWSEIIAKSLALRGVGPIHIYRGGYEEWKTRKLPLSRP